jgi:hypothetical protein
MIKDLTIILQGRCEIETLQLWKENYSDWNIIISTWVGTDIPFDIPPTWKLIKSQYPNRYAPFQNLDYQITSTLYGLDKVKTKYTIKLRADEYWSGVGIVYDKMKTNENKVLCGSMFFRKLGLYPYHISDHIICGTTENIKIMFDGAHDNLIQGIRLNNCPETILGCGFVFAKENIDALKEYNTLHLHSDMYLKKWFHIIDVNELKPYIATQRTEINRLYFYSNYDNCNCITEI